MAPWPQVGYTPVKSGPNALGMLWSAVDAGFVSPSLIEVCHMYYDINKTLSRQRLFNFVVGARGVGKTYAAKNRVIQNYLKSGAQFIYVRRYETELPAAEMRNFFMDISEAYPDHEFKSGKGLFHIDGAVAGWYVALSKAPMLKSIPFPNVTMIIFDEFIIETGIYHYINNEVRCFLDLYSTIARDRDVTVLFMSNAISMSNPYFIYFNLELEPGQKVKLYDDISLEVLDNPEFQDHMRKTRFGKLISDTPYGNYAINNKFLLDNASFVQPLSGECECLATFIVDENKYGYYNDRMTGYSYMSDKVDETCPRRIALSLASHDDSTVLAMRGNVFYVHMMDQFQKGMLKFTTIAIKNALYPYLKKLL